MSKINKIPKPNSDLLKIIAITSMAIDHIGYVFFPELIILRVIGRLAYPILAYQLAIGYEKTSNINKYLKRIFIFALISQIPFSLAFDTTELNTIFTLFGALLIIRLIDTKQFVLATLSALLFFVIPVDYGFYGALLPLIFWLFKKDRVLAATSGFAATMIYSLFVPAYQIFSGAGIIIALYLRLRINLSINKWAFYWFYPIHLIIIYIVNLIK